MKYYALLPLVLFFSCRTARFGDTQLSGQYTVSDFQMTGETRADSPAGRSLVHDICKSGWHFKFYGKDSVAVFPSFGMKYLGDSLFRYKIVEDTLVLASHKNIRKLALTDDHGLIRLYNLNPDIASVAIMNLKVH